MLLLPHLTRTQQRRIITAIGREPHAPRSGRNTEIRSCLEHIRQDGAAIQKGDDRGRRAGIEQRLHGALHGGQRGSDRH